MSKKNEKLREILDVVIENYLDKGDPIGSKFLHTLEDIDYAPSTLRKYLNMLEQDGLVYQPYNSSGRIPTREGISSYIDHYIDQKNNNKNELALLDMDTEMARNNLRYLVEKIGDIADGVVT